MLKVLRVSNINYLLTESEVFTGKSHWTPCRIDRARARSIQQSRGLGFSSKDRMCEINKLYGFSLLLQARNLPLDITGE